MNVVILRFGTGLPISSGRSKCFSCNNTLKWYELIPVFSYLFLRGKCRTCFSKISNQYFMVELLTGFLFIGMMYLYTSYRVTESFLFALCLIIGCLFIVIAVYDLHHKIIPDTFVFLFIICTLAVATLRYLNSEDLGDFAKGINILSGP